METRPAPAEPRADLGIIGLGVVGCNLARNAAERGLAVLGWDADAVRTRALADALGAAPAANAAALVQGLRRPRRILIRVPAGRAVDLVLDEILPLLAPGDVVCDASDSWFEDTETRQAALREGGLELLGVGVAGGESGARRGASFVAGGSEAAWERIAPLLEALAARGAAGPCAARVGPGGAGHFVAIVHDGIECALLEGIAEVYDLLARGLGLAPPIAAGIFRHWNRGALESFPIELAARVLAVRDAESGRPLIELVDDRIEPNGSGAWAARAADLLGVPVPSLIAAAQARLVSAEQEQRRAASSVLRRHVGALPPRKSARFVAFAERALLANQICAFAQGFELIEAASRRRGWGTRGAEIARVWSAGSTVRTRFLGWVDDALRRQPSLPTLLIDPEIGRLAVSARDGLAQLLAAGQRREIPMPVLSAALAWLDALRSERLPQSLTQAQRDACEGHGYLRRDDPGRGAVHTDWLAA